MDPHRMGGYLHKWYQWLEHMKKTAEKGKMKEMHQRKVKMI